MAHRNISIVWDFDGTLTPNDSTSKIFEYFLGKNQIKKLWKWIKTVNGTQTNPSWERLLSSDAPTWMYVLSRIAFENNVPLTTEFFLKRKNLIQLYRNVGVFLKKIKSLERLSLFQKSKINIHQFIVTAGLKEYVEVLVPDKTFSYIWGGRYSCVYPPKKVNEVESIPVFCMDETMKTRALYEISKGVFRKQSTIKVVNKKVETEKLWCPFENFIYIGDGPTDIPALSLTRAYGGYGIVVFNPKKSKKEIKRHLKNMSADSRCDLITKANFSLTSELFDSIKHRCFQIQKKYSAEDFSKIT